MTRIHIALTTPDLDAATRFYSALFGAGPDKLRPDYRRFAPDEHPIVLTFMHGEVGATDAGHYGLRFADVADTRAAWERATEAGLTVRESGEVTCCWSRQHKAWATDPDGRQWELYTITDDDTVRDAAGPVACCA